MLCSQADTPALVDTVVLALGDALVFASRPDLMRTGLAVRPASCGPHTKTHTHKGRRYYKGFDAEPYGVSVQLRKACGAVTSATWVNSSAAATICVLSVPTTRR